jgi:chemotaxis phosphatase CheX-like protein
MSSIPVSKILVLDNDSDHVNVLKDFCAANQLVPMRVRKQSVMTVLRTNIDLGAIFYSEEYGDSQDETESIAAEIHAARPELPIILRRATEPTLAGLSERMRRSVCAAYVSSDMGALRRTIDEYIFCLIYPNELLRGIAEITRVALSALLPNLQTVMETPYIVRDRVIYGELFSLMQLESSWCRGYMMLQTEEEFLLRLVERDQADGTPSSFRRVNDLLGEITNLIWGAFKNRYIGDSRASIGRQVQVPILVNHKHKYISFGTENPQLCFRYAFIDPVTGASSSFYQRFIFNLEWSPGDFRELPPEIAGLVASGELELF